MITSVNQTNSLCFGDNSGTINLTVSGGVLPYSYLWSNGATTPNLSGLAAGVYSVTIIDNNGCVNNQSITLTESLELISSINQTNSLCFGDNSGTINLTASGGVLPYSYLWSNGVTTPNLSALAAGVYTLTITDNIGCQITSSATILEPNLLTVITSTTNVSCNGNNDGSILATASGGSSPYQYSFLGLSQSNGTFSNLTSGTYNLEVTDANGCLINSLNSVVEPDALVVSFTTNDVICYGESNGSLSVSATGGTVAGSYVIDYAGINPSAISQGTYVFSLTDDNGCSSFPISPIVYTIGTAADIISTITATNPSCNGGSNGTAAVNITGGTGLGTYSYL